VQSETRAAIPPAYYEPIGVRVEPVVGSKQADLAIVPERWSRADAELRESMRKQAETVSFL
jgi:hypothetical protein